MKSTGTRNSHGGRAGSRPTPPCVNLDARECAGLVERCCTHAHSLVMRIGQLPGAEVLRQPTINQGVLRFPHPKPGAVEADHAKWTDEVIAAISATGEAFFTGSDWKGRRVMRVSVCNWQTSEEDVTRAVNAVAKVLEAKKATLQRAPTTL